MGGLLGKRFAAAHTPATEAAHKIIIDQYFIFHSQLRTRAPRVTHEASHFPHKSTLISQHTGACAPKSFAKAAVYSGKRDFIARKANANAQHARTNAHHALENAHLAFANTHLPRIITHSPMRSPQRPTTISVQTSLSLRADRKQSPRRRQHLSESRFRKHKIYTRHRANNRRKVRKHITYVWQNARNY